MPASASSVVLEQVSKRFGAGPLVLDRLSLSVAAGEFVSLIGPSGCGKSTLLRLVCALSLPTAGSILVGSAPPERKGNHAAFIFQEATLLPWLTVRRNIELPLRIRGIKAQERARIAREMLRLVRLGDVADRHPRQLSGGMKMRVSVARALAQSPGLLLLDEPFGALDEMTRHRLNEELVEMHEQRGWTALFVTHSVAEAVFLSDRIFIMAANPGRIHSEVAIALSRSRTAVVRETPEFQRTVADVTRRLRAVEHVA